MALANDESPSLFGRKSKHSGGSFCWVTGCANSAGKDAADGVKRGYYLFPTDPKRIKQWKAAIPREENPSKWSRVCSDHFVGGVKTNEPGSPGYVPSIFKGADELKGKVPPKTRLTRTAQAAGIKGPSPVKKKKVSNLLHADSFIPEPQGRPVNNLKPAQDPTYYPYAVWNSEHDYVRVKDDPNPDPAQACQKVQDLERQLEECCEKLKRAEKRLLSLENDLNFPKWTNLPNREVFDCLLQYLETRRDGLKYWKGQRTCKTVRLITFRQFISV